MLTQRNIVILLSVVNAFGVCAAQLYGNMTALKAHLLDGYHTDVLPREDISPIIINISITIFHLRDTDISTGTANVDIQVDADWIDINLKWNPWEYNNIEKVYFQQSEIWAPNIFVKSSKNLEQMNDLLSILAVDNNSNVRMRSVKNIDAYCTFDVQHWPFDKSLCLVMIMVNYYTNEAVQVQMSQTGDVLLANKTSAWNIKLIGHGTFFTPESSMAFVCLGLERNPTFYLFSILLPIVGILVLNSFVFILPIESGERISFSLTLILATAVFLTVIADEVPKASDPFPAICTFLFSTIVHGIVNTILLILNMRIYNRKSYVKIGIFYCILVKMTGAKCIINLVNVRNGKRQTNERELSSDGKSVDTQIGHVINCDNETTSADCINMDRCTQDSQDRAGMNKDVDNNRFDINCTWQDVGQAIDLSLFVLSNVFIIGGFIVFLYYLKVRSDEDDSYAKLCMVP